MLLMIVKSLQHSCINPIVLVPISENNSDLDINNISMALNIYSILSRYNNET